MAADGTLSGTPTPADIGPNTFTVSVTDNIISTPVEAILNIEVNAQGATVLLGGYDGNQAAMGTPSSIPVRHASAVGNVSFTLSTSDPIAGGFNWAGMQSSNILWGTTDLDPDASTANNNCVFTQDGPMTMTFTVTNTGTEDVTLQTLHWISKRDVSASASAATITYASGDLAGTSGVHSLGGIGTTGHDFDLGSILTDATLSAGQSATFTWYAGGDTSINTRLRVDNFAISGNIAGTPGNFAPVASDGSTITNEDSSVAITLVATDEDSTIQGYSVASGPANGTLSGTAPDLTYTPNADFNGADSFTFTANDGAADSNIAIVGITVNAVNDAPVASDNSATTDEDTAVAITLVASDIDNTIQSYAVVNGPANGTLSGTAPNLTYTPNADFNGADSFTFTANDGAADSNIATASITVNAVNDAPVASDNSATTDQDTAVAITLVATDIDSTIQSYAVVSGPANGTLSGTAPDLTYTPNANFTGADSFTFTANDGAVDSNTATVGITVNAVNEAPFWTSNPVVAAEAEEGVAYSQTLAGLATDPDEGGAIAYSKVSGPEWLSVAIDGTLSGTPPSGSAGLNSFVVRATDPGSATADATLEITVNGLPLPWVSTDIGTGMLAGSATYDAGTFTQAGSGVIGGTTDKFRFTYQILTGDGEIITRISSLQNTGNSSRVGVMIRESLAANSKQIFAGMTGSNAYRWSRRTSTGGTTSNSSYGTGTVPNTWVRLVRAGNTFTTYKSANGTSWTNMGSATMPFSSNCYIGLAVGSGSDTTLNTSQFSNVGVTP